MSEFTKQLAIEQWDVASLTKLYDTTLVAKPHSNIQISVHEMRDILTMAIWWLEANQDDK